MGVGSAGFDEAGFSGPTGGGDNKQVSGVVHGKEALGRFEDRLFYVLHLFTHLLDQDPHVHRDMGQFSAADLEPMVLASRCSSGSGSQSLADFSALGDQAFDFVRWELRRVISSTASMRMAKAVASVSARSCAASGRVAPSVSVALSSVPETLAVLFRSWESAAPLAVPGPATGPDDQQHGGQATAFTLARRQQHFECLVGQRQPRRSSRGIRSARRTTGGSRRYTQRGSRWQPGFDVVLRH